MTLSRWRRVVTGVAAGVIVLIAAMIGASFRNDGGGVSVASDRLPENVIPIEVDPGGTDDEIEDDSGTAVDTTDADTTDTGDADTAAEEAPEVEAPDADAPDPDTPDAGTAEETDDDETTADGAGDTDEADSDGTTAEPDESNTDEALTDPVQVIEDDDAETPAVDDEPADPPAEAAPVEPTPAPLPATDSSLGTGGGVDDAECALDRLVIYAGARRGGVAGSIRAALAQAGFGAGCPTPVTVLASNCPLQFSGVLGAGSGYDPNKSFVASNANVDRATMTAVMSAVGYSGTQIDILDFGFVNPDRPGEQWMAIFIPPSFDGWQDLANRAGLAPTTSSLCAPSGELAG